MSYTSISTEYDENELSIEEKIEIERVRKNYKRVINEIEAADKALEKSKEVKPFQAKAISIASLEINNYEEKYHYNIIKEVKDILEDSGFFTICDHGIPKDLINKIIQHARKFFSLDRTIKEKYIVNSSTIRGWTHPSYTRYDKNGNVVEVYKEAFHFGPDESPYDKNMWPSDIEFKNDMQTYYMHMARIEKVLLEAIAYTFNKPKNYLVDLAAPHKGLLRLNYFDTQGIDTTIPSVSFGGHTDWGTITILVQEKPGLEVIYKGEWYSIFPENDQLVVNIGDLMSLWSNTNYVSTVHRARHSNNDTRISIPYFGGHSLHPDDRTIIRPIINSSEIAKTEPTTFFDHIHLQYKHFDKIIRV